MDEKGKIPQSSSLDCNFLNLCTIYALILRMEVMISLMADREGKKQPSISSSDKQEKNFNWMAVSLVEICI